MNVEAKKIVAEGRSGIDVHKVREISIELCNPESVPHSGSASLTYSLHRYGSGYLHTLQQMYGTCS